MALVSVYDVDGVDHQKEPVDAAECVKVLGWTMDKPEPKEEEKAMTVAEIRKELEALGVEFGENAKKPELKELLEKHLSA